MKSDPKQATLKMYFLAGYKLCSSLLPNFECRKFPSFGRVFETLDHTIYLAEKERHHAALNLFLSVHNI